MTSSGAIKVGGVFLLLISSNLEVALGIGSQLFKSGDQHVSLLELYTSEGCSSCPPAEAWFSSLKDNPLLWKKFVPVAFHVDYWNYLGWDDPYSSADYTARQRAYEKAWHAGSIYTPEFVLNGKEWRHDFMEISGPEQFCGSLNVTLTNGGKVEIHFKPATQSSSSFVAELALLGCGITNDVVRGENAGRILRHDFVTIVLMKTEFRPADVGTYQAEVDLPSRNSTPASAIAVWVRQQNSLIPIQAVGGWLK